MHRITYFASVDDGVSFDDFEFRFLVMTYLHSPDGWSQDGYEFEEVPKETAHVHIRLSSSKTVETVCGLSPNLSCAELGGRHMYLNATRWIHGAPKSKLDLENYRQYMVSHEMGHILGKGHAKCPKKGALAPIMIQQTLGLHGCRPNTNVTK